MRYFSTSLFLIPGLLAATLWLTACGEAGQSTDSPPADAAPESATLHLVASNYPLGFFAQQLAPGHIEVVIPAFDGDPAYWKPSPEQVTQLQQADQVLLNGAGYESWLDWVTLPSGTQVDTSAAISDQLLPLAESTVHQHGPQGEHSHGGYAFTTWLDPKRAQAQAGAVAEAMTSLAPADREAINSAYEALQQQLTALDDSLRRSLAPQRGNPVLFSHPVYQYLADAYGLEGISVHWEPGESPGNAGWVDLHKQLNGRQPGLMLWEGAPDPATADRLRDMGIEPLVFETGSTAPEDGDYFSLMQANIKRLDDFNATN